MAMSNKSTFEGNAIYNITSQFGLDEMIKETMHIFDISSSRIDSYLHHYLI